MRMRRFVFAAAAAALAASAGHAENGEEREVVITAERTVDPSRALDEVREVGRSVTVIREEEIRRSGAVSLVEVLRDVPGLRVVQTGSFGGTTSIFTRGGESDFTLVEIDGVKVNDPGGFYDDWPNLSTRNIERIEIVRGPASFARGGDGASAVIRIVTKRAEEGAPPRYEIFAEGGRFSTAHEGISGIGTTGRVGWSFDLSRLDTKGHLPVNNDFGRTSLSGRIDAPIGDRTDASVSLTHFDRTFAFPTDAGGDLLPPFFLDPNGDVRDQQTTLGVEIDRRISDRWDATLSLEGLRQTTFNRDPVDSPAETSAFFREQETRRDAAALSFVRRGAWTVAFGGEIEREEQHDQRNATTPGTHIGRTNGAGWLTLGGPVPWVEGLDLTAGARYDDNSRFAREVSVSGSARYLVRRTGTTLRAAGGDGFSLPTLAQVAGATPTFRPNPNLTGEKEASWEVGFDQPIRLPLGDPLSFSATYFRARTKGLIGNVAIGGGVLTPRNAGRVERQGVEVGVSWRPFARWSVGGNWTWLETIVRDPGTAGGTTFVLGEPVLRRPEHQGNVTIGYTGDRLRATANLNAVSQSVDRSFANFQFGRAERRVRNPGYAKVDLSAEYDITESITLTASGFNLLDQLIQEAFGFSDPGRHWRAGLRWRF